MKRYSRLRDAAYLYRYDIGIAAVLLIVALVVRMSDLGLFLTADEKSWMQRGYDFVRAFKDARFNDMLQTTHPGVTALWGIGAAITVKMMTAHLPFSYQTLPHFITASQAVIALATGLAVPAVYGLVRMLRTHSVESVYVSRVFATCAGLFIALNPFLVGYSRVAHVDALLGSFLVVAVLTTIIYVQQGFSRKWLCASAVLSAAAILTKAPAIFMVPFFWLAVLVPAIHMVKAPRTLKSYLVNRSRDFVMWILIIGVLFVTVWPVFLTVPDPKGNVGLLQRDLGTAASTPHNMTESYSLNGLHYIYALATRSTPVVLLLSLISFGVLWRTRKSGLTAQYVPLMIWGFVLFFILMMTLGAKKGDRYIIPVFFALDIIAAYAVVSIGKYFAHSKRYMTVLGGIVVLYLASAIYAYHPYAVAYANPLFPDNLSQELGWGEGLDQVAAWLNEHDPNARVASWYDQELAAFTSATVLTLGAHEENTVKYVVLYRNMFGRAADHPANDFIDEYYTKREPVFVAYVHSKEFAWVYEKKTYPATTGDLLPSEVVEATVTRNHDQVIGFEAVVATYQGRATEGEVRAEVVSPSGVVVASWQVPVAAFEDDVWHAFRVDTPLPNEDEYVIRVYTTGTREGNAPTLRRDAAGNVAMRLLYSVADGQAAHDEHTKLLPANQ